MKNPLLPYLRELERPGRYLGGEVNAVIKRDYEKLLRFVLLYPETYEIGMSNLGLRILYHVLNSRDEVQAERAYLPWIDALFVMEREGIPLFTYETFTPLNEVDVIGISLQTELNNTSVLKALELSGVPIYSRERGEKDPVVIGGGPVAYNPLPLAPFFDAFVIGEGEEVVLEMIEPLLDFKHNNLKRDALLDELSKIEGVYVPSKGKYRVKRRFADLKSEYYPERPVVPNVEIIHDRLTIEIMRGCTRGCRFCQAGYVFRPMRIREPEEIFELSERALHNTGWDELGLLAFTVSDYPYLEELIKYLKAGLKNTFISLPSLPIDALSEEFLATFKGLRRFGLTLAPETPSQKLRDVINKNVPFELVYKSVELAEKYGWRHIKLYFMIGLPKEDEEDVREIARFLKELHRMSRRVVFKTSINTFIPKPHTPFEGERQLNVEEAEELLKLLKDETKRLKRVSLKWRDPRKSVIEGVLGRGDERLSQVIYEVYRIGAYLEDRSEFFNYERWLKAFYKYGIKVEDYLREREEIPWGFIDTGIFRGFFRKERERAYRGETLDNCMFSGCKGCGPWLKEKYPTCLFGLKIRRPPVIEGEEKEEKIHTYAFRFAKEDKAIYLGHNDFVRVIVTAMRRARFPIRYSKGFVPKPRMSFGPSLPLGVESECEWVVVETEGELSGDQIKKFEEELMEGLTILGYGELVKKPRWGILRSARYYVEVPGDGRVEMVDVKFGEGMGIFNRIGEELGYDKEEVKRFRIRRVALLTEEGNEFNPLESSL